MKQDIPGTTIFDGEQARKGMALNRMCFSFNDAENRAAFDLLCMDRLVANPSMLTRYSIHDIVAQAGSQGVELLNWIAMRGALTGRVSKIHSNYHIPISNTASALLALENTPSAEMRQAG